MEWLAYHRPFLRSLRIGYTHHHAISLLARDAGPRPDDAAGPSDPYLHTGAVHQVRPVFLSRSRVDIRPLSGAQRSGLRSGADRLSNRAENSRHLLYVREMDHETRSASPGSTPGPVFRSRHPWGGPRPSSAPFSRCAEARNSRAGSSAKSQVRS